MAQDLMVRAYEAQSVHNSFIDALVTQEIQRQKEARAKEEAERERETTRIIADLEARLYFAGKCNERLISNQIETARHNYELPKKPGLFRSVALVVAGYVALAFSWLNNTLGM